MNERVSARVEAVVFDWDGTLINLDERELHCINEALTGVSSRTISMKEFVEGYYLHPYQSAGGHNLIRKILEDEATAEEAVEIYSNEFGKTVRLVKPQENTSNVLQALKIKGLSLAVATLRRRRSLVDQELKYLEIDRFFDVLVTREDLKPEPGMKLSLSTVVESRAQQFVKTLMLLGKEPSETIIVGDSWWDVRAAKQVRAITAWVKTGFGAHNNFSREEPDLTLNCLEQLLEYVSTRARI